MSKPVKAADIKPVKPPKPVKTGGKPDLKDKGPKDKPAKADKDALKIKLKGHGMSQQDVDAVVTDAATNEDIVAGVVAIQRRYPKA